MTDTLLPQAHAQPQAHAPTPAPISAPAPGQARGSLRPNPYSTVTECLRIQSSARRRTLAARVFGANPMLPDARAWYRAALGELHVAKVLASVGPRWTALRADDPTVLLLSTAGAFSVTTKNHSRQRVWVGDDTILVNGHRTNHVRDARHYARAMTRVLGIPVTPVLAMIDPGHFDIKARPAGVEVLAATQLASFLSRRKPRLTDETVSMLLAQATAAGWSTDLYDETLRHETRFARLVAEVESAARRRAGWVALAGVVLLALILAATLVS